MLRLGKRIIQRLRGRKESPEKALYRKYEYLDAYIADTNRRVEADPHAAVGGLWEELGHLQFGFLRRRGLAPEHRMLDIGCGTLRGGRHFIRYLNAGNYTGMDIAPKVLEYGRELVQHEGLTHKNPKLVLSENKDLKFAEFEGQTFDYLLAQSVFTHLLPEHIEECFAHVRQVMHDESIFFFTFFEGKEMLKRGRKDFVYPRSMFESLADRYDFTLEDCQGQYDHPCDQKMVAVHAVAVVDNEADRCQALSSSMSVDAD